MKGEWFKNENIIRTISSEMNRYLNNYQMSKLQEVLYKKVEIEIPKEMLDDEVHRMMHQMEEQLKMQGITMEQYMQFSKLSHEDIFINIQENIQKNI